jgi:anaerobic magnesium-protoporphyrin IX monomethyl ester cyclase
VNKKPTILFVAVTPPEYAPSNVRMYGLARTFQLIPHKHSILALVAWLREYGCEGHYVWYHPGDESGPLKVEQAIRDLKPDAVGFSLVTEEMLTHYQVIAVIKARHPNLPVIVGGPHVSFEPTHTLKHFSLIDYIAIGEGEKTLTEWLIKIADGAGPSGMRDVAGLGFLDESGEPVITSPRAKFTDINELPDPAFDLLIRSNAPTGRKAAFPLVCSYGCCFYCTFCAADHGNYRYMSPERVVNQIKRAQEQFGAEYFAIRDSFWPPSSKWLDQFCTLIEEQDIQIQFHFETRAGTLTIDQWERLKRIGARAVAVGVESGDPNILKSIRKSISIKQARQTFEDLHRAGLLSVAFFMVGNQGENRETIRASERLAHELNPTLLSLATFRPLPGTEAYKYVKEKDLDWWMRGPYPSICSLTIDELNQLRAGMNIRYPVRWNYIQKHVLSGKLPREFRKLAWRACRVHLRKYMLGILERYGFLRVGIYGLKKLVRRHA